MITVPISPQTTATAVQLRHDPELRCTLLKGTPSRIDSGTAGTLAVFSTPQLVVYDIHTPHHHRAFAFLTATPGGKSRLPGVYPGVHLVLAAQSSGQVMRMMQAIRYLETAALMPPLPSSSSVGDIQTFNRLWSRVQAMLPGRHFRIRDIQQLVASP